MLDIGKEESRACLKGVKNFQSDVSENGPSPSLIEMAANSPQEAEPELLLGALLVAIRALPDMPEQVNLIWQKSCIDTIIRTWQALL